MRICGIQTHNLKNISFATNSPEIIGICGVSGGGKSSLAFHTIYSLCANSFNAVENGYVEDNQYIIKSYEKLLPALAIKQLNLNTNPRSTIYSYLNFSSALSSVAKIKYDLLKLNKPQNECPKCKATGYTLKIDETKIIDLDAKISEIPIIPFREHESLKILFLEFCNHQKINTNQTFKDLKPEIQDLLLHTKESPKFTIKYKHNKKPRTRHLEYKGVFIYLQEKLVSNKISLYKEAIDYCTEVICNTCNGSKINPDVYKNIYIGKTSFYDFLTMPIKNLIKLIPTDEEYKRINNILSACCNLGIGYLSLNRSIPTLSGGEIQKLNFANLISLSMSNLLIIIDEISTGLHHDDYTNIWQNITNLKKNQNTIILVEHNREFLQKCDRRICLGPVGGKDGGYIIEDDISFLESINTQKHKQFNDFFTITANINNIKNQQVSLPYHSLIAIIGKSGSGKSSLAKFLENNIKECIYISQKLPKGNIRSSIATYLEINKPIADYFANHFKKDPAFFMNSESSEIICSLCCGTGVIKYERGFESSINTTCPQCNGKMFNNTASEYIIDEKSILDFYNDELKNFCNTSIAKLSKIATMAQNLSLDYLSLNRKINTLSGGELKRLKILKFMLKNMKNKVLILDEPSAGLDHKNAQNIINVIKSTKTSMTIIIEHNPSLYLQADYIVELGPGSGDEGGNVIFQGDSSKYQSIKKL